MIATINLDFHGARPQTRARAYTLVEILVVLFVLMLLAAIALPTVKNLLVNQKLNRAARNLAAYIDKTRSRAIAEQRIYGLLIERGTGGRDGYSSSQSIRVRQIAGVPPYSGDASDSFAILSNPTLGIPPEPDLRFAFADFNTRDNQLLDLSRRLYQENKPAGQIPIRNGDYLELPGGRYVPITIFPDRITYPSGEEYVRVRFPLTDSYPDGERNLQHRPRVKYRVHRHPVVSAVTPFAMPRGVVIDLNFSGVGLEGNQFSSILPPGYAPYGDPPVPAIGGDVEIIFGPDGSVQTVSRGAIWNADPRLSSWASMQVPAEGTIFLCVGDSDGLWTESEGLFSTEKAAKSNLLNLESIWVTVNPYTGRCNAAPMAPIAGVLPSIPPFPSPALGSEGRVGLQRTLKESRLFATLSDSVDPE